MSINQNEQFHSGGDPFEIDVRGLKCPLPVLKAEKRMRPLASGTEIVVIATDPMAAIDIPNFCQENGHRFVGRAEDGELTRYTLIKA